MYSKATLWLPINLRWCKNAGGERYFQLSDRWYSTATVSAVCPVSSEYRTEPHGKAALHIVAWSGNFIPKEQLDGWAWPHLCDLSSFQSGKRFGMQHFQHHTLFCRTWKRTTRGTCPLRLLQTQPHFAQGSAYYAKLHSHCMQKCQVWLCRNEQYDCAKMHA